MDIKLQGDLHHDMSLAQMTTWRIGGKGQLCYRPHDLPDLQVFLAQLSNKKPITWLGLGSNTLIRDGGLQGVVILTQGALTQLSIHDEVIRAEAGLSCGQVARFAARNSLQGIEFLAGIPGTIGGALALNAGCFDGETWSYVTEVETIDEIGQIHRRNAMDFSIAYRQVTGRKNEWFVAAYFQLKRGDKKIAQNKIRQLLDHRAATQPTGDSSCGSVFRNPEGDYSGRLIEACGLKGYRIGGASISKKHANFIINEGGASALDIERLISHIQAVVEGQYGVQLYPEVHIIGEHAAS